MLLPSTTVVAAGRYVIDSVRPSVRLYVCRSAGLLQMGMNPCTTFCEPSGGLPNTDPNSNPGSLLVEVRRVDGSLLSEDYRVLVDFYV